ncbi:hypothetical protein H480_19393 [Amycolatopsis vancoresmycina DSM 44592]|uniref:Uncharacterized protein n=1 Tax=Amycolatopsis vancoresmycina DSM 44592 TaxID=1292037 RepID=R1G5Y3_9PSEU|nr:hypothetical protein H480_19393 [Amycolatopsis vancoresmycina DSM 44592]
MLSAVATAISFTWLPFDWPALGAVVALVVHAALALTITDTRDERLRRTAITVAAALAVLLVAGSVWAAAVRLPGSEPAVLLSVVQNTIGPLAVSSVRLGSVP